MPNYKYLGKKKKKKIASFVGQAFCLQMRKLSKTEL